MADNFDQARGDPSAAAPEKDAEKDHEDNKPVGFRFWGKAPGRDDEDEEGLSAEEQQRRQRAAEQQKDEDKQERQSGRSARAGFQVAAATEESAEDDSGGALDLSGRLWMSRKWLKNPKQFQKVINHKLDGIISKALDNDWKYVAVSRMGKIDPILATLLKNRVLSLSVENRASDKVLTKMGFDTPEARREARQALQHMVVLNETFSMKNFHKLGKAGEEAVLPAAAAATAAAAASTPAHEADAETPARRAGLRRPPGPSSV